MQVSTKIKTTPKKISILGPPITSTTELDAKALLNKDNHSNSIATGPFIMKTPALVTYSQQLWVIAKLSTENTDGRTKNRVFGLLNFSFR